MELRINRARPVIGLATTSLLKMPIQDIRIIFWLNFNGVNFTLGISLLQMQIKMCTIYQIVKCVSLKCSMLLC